MRGVSEFSGHDASLAQHALRHKQWLKSYLVALFASDRLDGEGRAEAIMTLLEGMIVRAASGETVSSNPLYRRTLHLVAASSSVAATTAEA